MLQVSQMVFRKLAFLQPSAKNGEVLTKDENQPAVDSALPCNYGVAREMMFLHAKIHTSAACRQRGHPDRIQMLHFGPESPTCAP